MDPASLCSELVKIRSVNPPGDCEEAVDYIADLLEGLGIRGTVTRNMDGRCNFVTARKDAPLLLCGHLDVVPAMDEGWSYDPFSGEVADGVVRGRGATDMKGGCAALICALSNLIEKGIDPDVNLAFVCDEESGGEFGIRHLLARDLIRPSDCLIAEPSPQFSPCIGQKGLCRLKIQFSGQPGHGSLYPHVGVSAIMEAYDLLAYLGALNRREFETDAEMEKIFETSAEVLYELFPVDGLDAALRRITFNPGRISGGEEVNIVAQQCSLDLDMRVPWGCSPERLRDELASHAPSARITPVALSPPSYTSCDSEIVQVTCDEVERVYGRPARPIVQWAASDARFLRPAGFSVLEYGPGEIHTLHGIDEYVRISELAAVTEIYEGIVTHYSGLN